MAGTKERLPEVLAQLGVDEDPFSPAVDARFYFYTSEIKQRLDLIQHLVEFSRQVVVVAGPPGSGRTAMLREVQARARESWRVYPLAVAEVPSVAAVVRDLARVFRAPIGDQPLARAVPILEAHIGQMHRNALLPVVLVDDAEALPPDLISLLLYLARPDSPDGGLRIVFFARRDSGGPTEWAGRKVPGGFPHLLDLPPFTRVETARYLKARLQEAGCPGDPGLDEEVLDRIFVSAAGLPGRVAGATRQCLSDLALRSPRPGGPGRGLGIWGEIGRVLGIGHALGQGEGGAPANDDEEDHDERDDRQDRPERAPGPDHAPGGGGGGGGGSSSSGRAPSPDLGREPGREPGRGRAVRATRRPRGGGAWPAIRWDTVAQYGPLALVAAVFLGVGVWLFRADPGAGKAARPGAAEAGAPLGGRSPFGLRAPTAATGTAAREGARERPASRPGDESPALAATAEGRGGAGAGPADDAAGAPDLALAEGRGAVPPASSARGEGERPPGRELSAPPGHSGPAAEAGLGGRETPPRQDDREGTMAPSAPGHGGAGLGHRRAAGPAARDQAVEGDRPGGRQGEAEKSTPATAAGKGARAEPDLAKGPAKRGAKEPDLAKEPAKGGVKEPAKGGIPAAGEAGRAEAGAPRRGPPEAYLWRGGVRVGAKDRAATGGGQRGADLAGPGPLNPRPLAAPASDYAARRIDAGGGSTGEGASTSGGSGAKTGGGTSGGTSAGGKRPRGRYVLQLFAVHHRAAAQAAMARRDLAARPYLITTQRDGKPWYIVLYGDYATPQEAQAAARRLPPDLQRQHPWPRLAQGLAHLFP
jgi:septal ring-binding cell division protein DamX/type II secretory pathway predicted ATPase ExeA